MKNRNKNIRNIADIERELKIVNPPSTVSPDSEIVSDPPDDPAWTQILQELQIGLHAAFGPTFKHLEDPLVLAYWLRQFQDRHLTPEDIHVTLRQITHRETKPPTLADFLTLALHIRESRLWRAHHTENQP